MDRFLTEEYAEKLRSLNEANGVHVGLGFDAARAKRWAHLFEAEAAKGDVPEELKAFYDINKDPVLEAWHVPLAERQRRRWMAESILDTMAQTAAAEVAGRGIFHETTTTSDIQAFTTWALPMVRKYMPQMFLPELVPTYPMSQSTGKVFTLDATYGSAGGSYSSGTSLYDSFDPTYAADPGECSTTSEVDISVSESDITAISRKLKGVWSIESAQNLQAYHKLIMENEVVKAIGQHINREVNRYGINQLLANVATNTNWNSSQPMASTNAWSNAIPREYNESLWDSIEDANKAIKDAQYVDANWILCGTTFASRLRKLKGFAIAPRGQSPVESDIMTGPNLFGTLNQRYRLYEDPDFAPDKAMIGYRPPANNMMYTGATFCPYIPVWRTPIVHTTTLCPGVGYMTRFAFKVINGSFYGSIVVY